MSDKRVKKYLQVGTMECMLLCMGIALLVGIGFISIGFWKTLLLALLLLIGLFIGGVSNKGEVIQNCYNRLFPGRVQREASRQQLAEQVRRTVNNKDFDEDDAEAQPAEEPAAAAEEALDQAAGQAEAAVQEAGEAAQTLAQEAGDAVQAAAQDVKDTAETIAQEAGEAVQAVREKAEDIVHSAEQEAQSALEEVREKVTDTAQDVNQAAQDAADAVRDELKPD